MYWPLPSDYQSVVQNPCYSLTDSTLKASRPELDKLGFPKAISGNFAVVFPVSIGNQKWAVRCFSRPQSDRQERYSIISDYLKKCSLPYMPDFEYLKDGIRVKGTTFPIIKMRWLEGELLDSYIRNHIWDTSAIKNLANSLVEMMNSLRSHKIAHGDLQHRNILVTSSGIHLIDFDGMFVPGLEQFRSCEQGHPNYQSPFRTETHFGSFLDNFSAWVIYLSLTALAADPKLWELNADDEECLILKKSDFVSPEISPCLRKLEEIRSPELNRALKNFMNVLSLEVRDIPSLDPKRNPTIVLQRISSFRESWLDIFPQPAARQVYTGGLPEWIKNPTTFISSNQTNLTSGYKSFNLHLTFDRIMFGIGLVLTLSLIFASQILNPVATWLLVFGLGLYLTAVTSFGYHKSDPYVAKNEIKKYIENITYEISDLKNNQATFEGNLLEIVRNEQQEIEMLALEWNKSSEVARMGNEKNKRSLDASLIAMKSENGNKNLADELRIILAKRNEEAVTTKLKYCRIIDANISGFSNNLKLMLAQKSMYTAADIKDYNVDNLQIAYIRRTDNWLVHIPGIGPSKAGELFRWKNNLEDRFRKETLIQPTQQEILQAQNNLKQRDNKLTIKETELKKDYEHSKQTINMKCQNEHSRIRNQLMMVQKRTGERLEACKNDLLSTKKQISEYESENIKKQNEIALYSRYNFYEYMFRVCCPLDDNSSSKLKTQIDYILRDIKIGIKQVPQLLKELYSFLLGKKHM